MVARYVVDECSFEVHNESRRGLESTFVRFLDLLDYTTSTGDVYKWSALLDVQCPSGSHFWELLFEGDRCDRDIRLELGMRLDRLRNWDEVMEHSPGYSFNCAGKLLEMAPSIGLALLLGRSGVVMGCLATDQADRRGLVPVVEQGSESGDESLVSFLVSIEDGPDFWRSIIATESPGAAQLEELARLAYPNCIFAEGLWAQLSNFEGSAQDYLPRLHHNLRGLNDHAPTVWAANVEPNVIMTEMNSRGGVDCSPESPNTKQNKKAARQRLVHFGSEEIDCQWHAKLEQHRNRIHFAVRGQLVYVGIYATHLAT